MKRIAVKDIMVPIEQYATVDEDATLADAIRALYLAQQNLDNTTYPHRAVLVLDKENHPIGKISQLDALKSLEPKYKEIQGEDSKSGFRHFSRMFIHSMLEHHRLFCSPLDNLRRKAAAIKVKDFMHTISDGDCLDGNATLDEACHILIMGEHQSLLVCHQNRIVGILKLTDVFSAVFQSLAES